MLSAYYKLLIHTLPGAKEIAVKKTDENLSLWKAPFNEGEKR